MASKPWMTTDDIIESIKRNIAVPISQNTFSNDDLLSFCNTELQIGLVPQILSYHEEYFVITENVPLEDGIIRYSIPERAIGLRLRNVFYIDSNGNPFEMTRINPEDKSYFLNNNSNTEIPFKYYLEGNDIVLLNQTLNSPTGDLQFVYYLRPNQLVEESRAAIIDCFGKDITCVNASIVAGDTVTINNVVFTAVSGSPSTNQFQIGGTSTVTAANLATAINTNGVVEATATGVIVSTCYNDRTLSITTSNASGFDIDDLISLEMTTDVPSNITAGSYVDLLQTRPGHKTRNFNILVPSGGVSGHILKLNEEDVSEYTVAGDYVCSENECIIPQIPSDLHISLVERACARILSSLGDQNGLVATKQKLQEIEGAQSVLMDNRVDGSPQKVLARNTLLRRGKLIYSRKI